MQLNVACLLKYCIYVWCKIVLIIIINFIINLINNSIFVTFKSQNSQFNQRSCESCYQIITFFSVKHRLTGWLSVLPITRWAAVANIVFLASAVCVCVCVLDWNSVCVSSKTQLPPATSCEVASVTPTVHRGRHRLSHPSWWVCVCVWTSAEMFIHGPARRSVRVWFRSSVSVIPRGTVPPEHRRPGLGAVSRSVTVHTVVVFIHSQLTGVTHWRFSPLSSPLLSAPLPCVFTSSLSSLLFVLQTRSEWRILGRDVKWLRSISLVLVCGDVLWFSKLQELMVVLFYSLSGFLNVLWLLDHRFPNLSIPRPPKINPLSNTQRYKIC